MKIKKEMEYQGLVMEIKNLISPHPLANIEIQKCYQNESRFNGFYSRDNFPKNVNDGAYVINFIEYADVGTHWIAL